MKFQNLIVTDSKVLYHCCNLPPFFMVVILFFQFLVKFLSYLILREVENESSFLLFAGSGLKHA